MIKQVTTIHLLQEEETDGHHPMKFECSDGAIYYCKYRVTMKQLELDCLAYELVAHYLLEALEIPTPDVALVTLTVDAFNPKHLPNNKRYAKPGIICFGSKAVTGANLINGTQVMAKRKEFNRYVNATDLIKISIFDLWIDNFDRGREDNLNILEAPVKDIKNKFQYYAIDNAFIFGGIDNLRLFNPLNEINTSNMLIENEYFRSVIKFVPIRRRLEIADNFVNLLNDNYNNALQKAFSVIPVSWQVPQIVKDRMTTFLSNRQRVEKVDYIVKQKLKRK